MNIFLWVLQGALALHTLMGAVWKFKNTPEKTMPTLKAIPIGAWRVLGVFEIICAIGLIVPAFYQSYAYLVSTSAVGIAAVMFLFSGMHLASGDKSRGPVIYWIAVAFVCAVIVYGRSALAPF